MYKLLQPLLFKLDAELSHDLAIKTLSIANKHSALCSLISKSCRPESIHNPVNIMGLDFPNRVGLAAGLDKHAQCINAFAAMGFGFIETGTVTPLPQAGNEKPRLFRLPEHQAIINRMGFNSVGLDQFIKNYKKRNTDAIIGINLGKNAVTPLANAVNDYIKGMQRTFTLADYLTINLSSPNTKQLRELQRGDSFEQLVMILKREQTRLADQHGKYTPLAIKIAPDLSKQEIQDIAAACMTHKIDCIIATNTTTHREMLADHPLSHETGGLSGPPVKSASNQVIQTLANILQGEIPIIGVGGINCAEDAVEKIQMGANLVQIYTGLIYQGPRLIKEIGTALSSFKTT